MVMEKEKQAESQPEWVTGKYVVDRIVYPNKQKSPLILRDAATGEACYSTGTCLVRPSVGEVVEARVMKTTTDVGKPIWRFRIIKSTGKINRREQIVWKLREIPGVGPKGAKDAWEQHGAEAYQRILDDPTKVAEYIAANRKKDAAKALEFLKAQNPVNQQAEHALLKLGFTAGRAKGIVQKSFGNGSKVLKLLEGGNPYDLQTLPGVGFKTVDKAIMSLDDVSGTDILRMRGFFNAMIAQATLDGSTFLGDARIPLFLNRMDADNKPESSDLIRSINTLIKNGVLYGVFSDLSLYRGDAAYAEMERRGAYCLGVVSDPKLPRMEMAIARWVMAMLTDKRRVEGLNPEGCDSVVMSYLEPAQKEAVYLAIRERLSILTGLPGSGKTFTLKAIIQTFGAARSIILAPTGMARKRARVMSGLPNDQCFTVHMYTAMLRQLRREEPDGDPVWAKPSLIVIDEFSMQEVEVLARLLPLFPRNVHHVVIVGDIHQLPPVGPGQVMADMLGSEVVPTTVLTKIHRQAEGSRIIQNALAINKGEKPDLSNEDPDHGSWFTIIEDYGFKGAARLGDCRLKAAMKSAQERWGLDPVKDIQVLCLSKRGLCGTTVLNERLRQFFNPSPPKKPEVHTKTALWYRQGDKVICSKNYKEKGLTNGDVGTVKEIGEGYSIIDVDGIGDVRLERGGIKGGRRRHDERFLFQTSYAITVHKSQGSEYDTVFLFLTYESPMFLNQKMLYTAITRAKKRLVLFTTGPKKSKVAAERRLAAWDLARRKEDFSWRDTLLERMLTHLHGGGTLEAEAQRGFEGEVDKN